MHAERVRGELDRILADKTVKAWDVESGRKMPTLEGHSDYAD